MHQTVSLSGPEGLNAGGGGKVDAAAAASLVDDSSDDVLLTVVKDPVVGVLVGLVDAVDAGVDVLRAGGPVSGRLRGEDLLQRQVGEGPYGEDVTGLAMGGLDVVLEDQQQATGKVLLGGRLVVSTLVRLLVQFLELTEEFFQ